VSNGTIASFLLLESQLSSIDPNKIKLFLDIKFARVIFEQKGSPILQVRASNQIINQSVKPIEGSLQHAINL